MEVSNLDARKELIDTLEEGDLIRLNGALRVVRSVTPGRCKQQPVKVRWLILSILRCSWTRRPYTVKSRFELYHAKLEIVRRGYGVEHGPIEVMLQDDIKLHRHGVNRILECCDVIGVVS